MRKICASIDELTSFLLNTDSSFCFNENDDKELVVLTHGKLSFSEDDENKHREGLLPVHLQSCHINRNLNKSSISEEDMTENMPSFLDRPILGYIHKVNDQYEFYSHNMTEENGETVYQEIPVGHILSSSDLKLVYDSEKEQTYLEADGFVYKGYTKAAEIIEREQECPVSVEIVIREMAYDAINKQLDIKDFYIEGVTILGKDDNGKTVNPGMKGANIKIADFSLLLNNSELNAESHSNNTTENTKEGGNVAEMNKFEELLNKYNKTPEDIDFEYEGMSDEELEAKFKELFDAENNSQEVNNDPENHNGQTAFENMIRTYEISHEDLRYALYNLLETYEVSDDTYYWITNVYDSYFVYEDYCGDKIYKQEYSKDGDEVSFSGERVELFKELLTASEKAELDAMRANYSEIKDKLSEYEAKDMKIKKDKLLSSNDYIVVKDTDEFKELAKDSDKYSFDELQGKCDALLLRFVKAGGKFTYAEDPENKHTNRVGFSEPDTEYKPYGGILDE